MTILLGDGVNQPKENPYIVLSMFITSHLQLSGKRSSTRLALLLIIFSLTQVYK